MMKNESDLLLRLCKRVAGTVSDALADHQLLERFVVQRDGAAFAALMERHGPMVLAVCQRALNDEQLAEDVLQATFLILARNAAAIRNRQSLGSWLHGVALRLARKAKADAARAGRGDTRPDHEPPPCPAVEASWREVRQILDEELQRLPENYRLPLVLCYLEGRTRDEAAAELGWTLSRLKGLLERARERLRSRLIRRGLAPAVAGSAILVDTALAAPVPPLLAVATLRAALRLASGEALDICGVSKTVVSLVGGFRVMGSKKLALMLVLALGLGVLGAGSGLLVWRAMAAGSAGEPVASPPVKQPDKVRDHAVKPVDDRKAIIGLWRVESMLLNGKDFDNKEGAEQKGALWRFTEDAFTVEIAMADEQVIYAEHAYKLDPTKTPKTLDAFPVPEPGQPVSLRHRQRAMVYALDSDTLKLCQRTNSKSEVPEHPTEVLSKGGSETLLYTLKRVPPEQVKPKLLVEEQPKEKPNGDTSGKDSQHPQDAGPPETYFGIDPRLNEPGWYVLAWLLHNKSVQRELKLTPEQITQVEEAATAIFKQNGDEVQKVQRESPKWDAAVRFDLYHAALKKIQSQCLKAFGKELIATLKPEQVRRLVQIQRQRRDATVFNDPDVEKALLLTAEQCREMQTIVNDFSKEWIAEWSKISGLGFDPELWKTKRELAIAKVVAVLNDEQKKKWRDLIGAPFAVKLASEEP
jgi:RNA polymerase sigma factor (sigma-70 family)